MEIGIKEVRGGKDEYIVSLLGEAVTAVWASYYDDLREWIVRIRKTYKEKLGRRKLVVSLSGDRSLNYANGRSLWNKVGKSMKDEPYELLQMCVENDVVLLMMPEWDRSCFPKTLKDFLNDNGVTVAGVGIREFATRMERDYGWIMTNQVVELRELASQKVANDAGGDFSRFGVARLSKAVLGEEVDFVKPAKLRWWADNSHHHYPYGGTNRLDVTTIKFAAAEVFLVSRMANTLLE